MATLQDIADHLHIAKGTVSKAALYRRHSTMLRM